MDQSRQEIISDITSQIYSDNSHVITVPILQNVLKNMAQNFAVLQETYTKEEVLDLIKKITAFRFQVVASLPKNPETNVYIPLLKMKEIIEANNIQLKEKYLEFLYYYMKKFSNPESNLEDLDFDLLNNLFSAEVKNNEIVSTTSNMNNNSVTEITNEEYEKHLKESLDFIKLGVKNSRVTFDEFVKDITYQTEVDGKEYKYFTIENFNEELRKCNIDLSELQLSCLCNKYSIPDNLKYIDKNKIEKDINIK